MTWGRLLTRGALLALAVSLLGSAAASASPVVPTERCLGPVVAAGQPALVAVVIDGITSEELDSGSADPLGIGNWCPALPDGTQRRLPRGIDEGYRVWAGFSTKDGKPNTVSCLPEGGLGTDACLVGRLADAGAIILPYSYQGAVVERTAEGSSFRFTGYTSQSTTQPPAASVAQLDRMLRSIATAWPSAQVMVVAHSYGGVVAQSWWEANHARLGNVGHVFTLDSPINGFPYCAFATVVYSPSTAQEFCRRWNARDALNAQWLAMDADESFVPMSAPNDPAYDEPVSGEGLQVAGGGGLRDQLIYRCPDDGRRADSPCIASPPSLVARDPACDASGPGIHGRTGHHLVIACPEVVRRIVREADTGARVRTTCGGPASERPRVIAVGCRAGAPRVRRIAWTSWGRDRAAGVGRLRGRRVSVSLSRLLPCDAARRFEYSRMLVSRRGIRPLRGARAC